MSLESIMPSNLSKEATPPPIPVKDILYKKIIRDTSENIAPMPDKNQEVELKNEDEIFEISKEQISKLKILHATIEFFKKEMLTDIEDQLKKLPKNDKEANKNKSDLESLKGSIANFEFFSLYNSSYIDPQKLKNAEDYYPKFNQARQDVFSYTKKLLSFKKYKDKAKKDMEALKKNNFDELEGVSDPGVMEEIFRETIGYTEKEDRQMAKTIKESIRAGQVESPTEILKLQGQAERLLAFYNSRKDQLFSTQTELDSTMLKNLIESADAMQKAIATIPEKLKVNKMYKVIVEKTNEIARHLNEEKERQDKLTVLRKKILEQ